MLNCSYLFIFTLMLFVDQEAKLGNPFTAKTLPGIIKQQGWSMKKKIGLGLALAAGGYKTWQYMNKYYSATMPELEFLLGGAFKVCNKKDQNALDKLTSNLSLNEQFKYALCTWTDTKGKKHNLTCSVGHGTSHCDKEIDGVNPQDLKIQDNQKDKEHHLFFAYIPYFSYTPYIKEDNRTAKEYYDELFNLRIHISRGKKISISYEKLQLKDVCVRAIRMFDEAKKLNIAQQAAHLIYWFYIWSGRDFATANFYAKSLAKEETNLRKSLVDA